MTDERREPRRPAAATQDPYISTARAAEALGVSVSTVKRWVDEDVLPAHRTAGGHRKLLRAEVLALARRGEVPHQDLAGLVLSPVKRGRIAPESVATLLHAALLRGDASEARTLIRRACESGIALETLADEIVAPVMHRVGRDWESSKIDVWHEHRASEICRTALNELLGELQPRVGHRRPLAVGCAVEGDQSQLSTLLAQLVLLEAGWNAVNLGPNTPFSSLTLAIKELHPRLVWLSASHLVDANKFIRGDRDFYRESERAGVPVAVGGYALTEAVRSRMPYTTYGDGLTHLAAFARTLHPRPARPRRGRPPKS